MGDEFLIFEPKSSTTIHLNQTAGLILELCENNSVADIVAALQEHYPEHQNQIPEQVASVIDDLVARAVLIPKLA